MTKVKVKSKWKRNGNDNDATTKKRRACGGANFVQLTCLNCGTLKKISLQKPCLKKKKIVEQNNLKDFSTPNVAKKLFSNSPYQSTPVHLLQKLSKSSTPSSVNLPIINKPSKSAKKSFRMKPKTLIQ